MADINMWQDRAVRQQFMVQGRERFSQIRGRIGNPGGVVAIEPKSGEFFWGDTLGQANDAARSRYLDHWLYFVRLDNPAAAIPLPVW